MSLKNSNASMFVKLGKREETLSAIVTKKKKKVKQISWKAEGFGSMNEKQRSF